MNQGKPIAYSDLFKCQCCGTEMITWSDITGNKDDDEGYYWCPKCSPHDGNITCEKCKERDRKREKESRRK